ncbi:hypothetical protein GCM10010326_77870 [Streptomyces xanthochromogenes]|uniref:Uncharacterized protein n=1 Tax=Streptomyces xanthochromogenes TaxID=67384 RepID=A0ABQ3B3A8_9ACTN|nr:hypothetical protein GCM10010326_77870 [Streptomyces xanthochromogenes]
MPLWRAALGGGVEPVEYEMWVTSAELRPVLGVGMSAVPTVRGVGAPSPARWAWVLARRGAGGAVVHAAGCRLGAGRGREAGTEAALGSRVLDRRCARAAMLRRCSCRYSGAGRTGAPRRRATDTPDPSSSAKRSTTVPRLPCGPNLLTGGPPGLSKARPTV